MRIPGRDIPDPELLPSAPDIRLDPSQGPGVIGGREPTYIPIESEDGTITYYPSSPGTPGTYQTYQSAFSEQFGYVRDVTHNQYDWMPASNFNDRINFAASRFNDQYGHYPSAVELLNWPTYQQMLQPLVTGTAFLPDNGFWIQFPDERGSQFFFNDRVMGLTPLEQSTIAAWYQGGTAGRADLSGLPPSQRNAADVGGSPVSSQITRAATSGAGPTDIMAFLSSKSYSLEEFQGLLQSLRPVSAGRGGGGGRGGGRADRAFDRDQLIEAGRTRWQGLMIEDPANIEDIVDRYMAEANAFWVGQGGDLDFDTFLKGEMRKTPRHKMLFRRKADWETEEEYIGKIRGAVEPYGLRASKTRQFIESGARAGTSVTGLRTRVSKSPQMVANNVGSFSQRFAQTLAPFART